MERTGQVNQYDPWKVGTGRRPVFTVNLANGTTPFMKSFDGVEFASRCYRLDATICTVTHAWYRPRAGEFGQLDSWSQDHVLNGGLLLADLNSAAVLQLYPDPVPADWEYEQFQGWCLSFYGKRRPPMPTPTQEVKP
jgi:hypothetical protein